MMVLTAYLSYFFFAARPAGAVTCSGAPNWHTGRGRDLGSDKSWRGVEGKIEHRPVTDVCTPVNGSSFSNAWLGLGDSDPASSTKGGIAQIGMTHNSDTGGCNCERFFWEWGASGEFHHAKKWGIPNGGALHSFQVNWYGAPDNKIHMRLDEDLDGQWDIPPSNVDGVEPVTDFGPGSGDGDAVTWSWIIPFFDEEIAFQQSDYKGTSSNKSGFTTLKIRKSDLTWKDADWISQGDTWRNVDNHESRGHCDRLTDTSGAMWN
jgi:hypothetical protein